MEILSQVVEGMQGVLTKTADMIGRETGFIKRLRKLSGRANDKSSQLQNIPLPPGAPAYS